MNPLPHILPVVAIVGASMARPTSSTVKFQVRFRETIRARLAAKAKDNGRSLNSEMVARLEQSFQDE